MTNPGLLIGGFVPPPKLVQLLEAGRWVLPAEQVLKEVFGDDPDDPRFYDLPSMLRQNELYRALSPEIHLDLDGPDSDVDPARCVLIGDLGADMSIALYYGSDHGDPRVIYYGLEGWREVAPSFGVLAERLGL
ncbi:hypothetical protein AB0283_33525 [Micromonospora vinacea]|uniref:hypothetical protein n=1 Tax=Micromonospora vinacea TaxID=709878 RepID=UPI00344EE5A2